MMGSKTRAYTALPEPGKLISLFTIEVFIYDAERDVYTCPQDETLHRLGRRSPVRISANSPSRQVGE